VLDEEDDSTQSHSNHKEKEDDIAVRDNMKVYDFRLKSNNA
jgi:hypothetical protein